MISTSLEERLKIVSESEKGVAAWRISKKLGWRPETIRKWRRRGQQKGRAGLVTKMGRPKRGALSSYPEEVRETIKRWREAHPGWGAKTIAMECRQHPAFVGQKIPSIAGIERFLREQNLSKKHEKRVALPESQQKRSINAHDVWEMDAQGYQQIPDVGMVTLINLNDKASHMRLLSYPCFLGRTNVERHANTADYQVALRLAFTDWGLPKRLQVDHESVFFDNKTKSPFPTRLHLWLVALGVQLTFSRVGRPTDQGMTERSHQLWSQQVIEGQHFPDWDILYQRLRQRRDFLNKQLPCTSLDGQPPLIAEPDAHFSGRAYRPEYEAQLLDLDRVYAYLSQGQWFRRVATHGIISIGGHVYSVGLKWQRQQIEVRFSAEQQLFCCYDDAGALIKQFAWRGDLEQILSGDVAVAMTLPHFQLCLPFTWQEHRDQHFWRCIDETTL